MAKASKMMIVPDRPNDLSAVVATAMGLHTELSAKAKAGSRAEAAAAAKPTDWAAGR